MKFNQYKKELQRKIDEENTMKELNNAINTLTKKRDNYIAQAKDAYRTGNMSQYKVCVALLKNAIFNLKQAQDMVANFTIAKDMIEMQTLNKHFVKSLDGVMKNVYKTCKAIHVSNSEKTFMKALFLQSQTNTQLQEALQNNNITFASSVNSLSDISDEEVKDLLDIGIGSEDTLFNDGLDENLDKLERSIMNDNKVAATQAFQEVAPKKEKMMMGGPSRNQSYERKEEKVEKIDNVEKKPKIVQEPKQDIIMQEPQKPVEEALKDQSNLNDDNKDLVQSIKIDQKDKQKSKRPEDEILGEGTTEGGFLWDNIPEISFDDIAGLDEVKDQVRIKVLLPLTHPDAFEGYEKKNGGGLCLYGPPGTGKTMIAAAIAHEIGAKFCSVTPSMILETGFGSSEKLVRKLFQEARKFPCAVIYFDEMDSIAPKNTKSTYAAHLRSEFLAQLQGIDAYGKDKDNLLFLICSTNKPWNIDSAFLRPGRFGTRIYVGLPDEEARKKIIDIRFDKIRKNGLVEIKDDIDYDKIVEKTNGYNCSDITNVLDSVEEVSVLRGIKTQEKYICQDDFDQVLERVHSTVQVDDLVQLKSWQGDNDK